MFRFEDMGCAEGGIADKFLDGLLKSIMEIKQLLDSGITTDCKAHIRHATIEENSIGIGRE